MKILPYVRYTGAVAAPSYGRIPQDVLLTVLASGRQCGVLLEYEIAQAFGLAHGGQGAAADLLDGDLKIQVKTFHRKEARPLKSGPGKGSCVTEKASIWTTKSGYWDRANRLTPEQKADAEAYIQRYDYFMYIDISRMTELEYEFVLVPSGDVDARRSGFFISQEAIYRDVKETLSIPAS